MVTKTSCSFSSRSVKDAAQILRWDRGDEQLTPSSGTGVHCQRLHQNNAAFLYDKRQFHGLKGKLGRVCQIPGWSWVWSSVDSWENLFSKSSSSLNTQEKTNLLIPFPHLFPFTVIRSHWRLKSLPETPTRVALFRAWHLCPGQCSAPQESRMEEVRWKQFQPGWPLTLEEQQWTAATTQNYYWTGKTPE